MYFPECSWRVLVLLVALNGPGDNTQIGLTYIMHLCVIGKNIFVIKLGGLNVVMAVKITLLQLQQFNPFIQTFPATYPAQSRGGSSAWSPVSLGTSLSSSWGIPRLSQDKWDV